MARWLRVLVACIIVLLAWLLLSGNETPPPKPVAARQVHAPRATPSTATTAPPPLVAAARAQIGVTTAYDPSYVRLPYPGGDVPRDRGVCTDVVIRAFRAQDLDLQQRVHEDMRGHFMLYPRQWGLQSPDRNIDHRRVPNLQRWFERQGWSLPVSDSATVYRAGDLVTWDLGGNVPHIGIVSDRQASSRQPLIIHNIGAGTREEDILFRYRITGHYRPVDQAVRR